MSQPERFQLRGTSADLYERYQVPAIFAPWAADLLARVALHPGERVLDVACGTGIVARTAAQQVGASGSVAGVDLNAGMLAMAHTQALRAGVTVDWRESDAEALPFAEATFDVVLCQQGLQFFPDKARALREMHRVLVPGGRLALSVLRALEYNPFVRAQGDTIERYLGPEFGARVRAPCSFGDAEALRALLTEAGFSEVHIHIGLLTIRHASPAEFLTGMWEGGPWAGAIASLEPAVRTALINDACMALRPYTDDAGLAIPHAVHIAVAHT